MLFHHAGHVKIAPSQSRWRGWGLWDSLAELAGKPSLSGQSADTVAFLSAHRLDGLYWPGMNRGNLVFATCLLGELLHSLLFAGPHQDLA